MKRAIKLVIYYFCYQLLFTTLITLPSVWIQLMNNGGDVNAFTGTDAATNTTGLTMVLSGIVMIWHLIHFKYVKFNLQSFKEVPAKTIWLSIPLILGAMTFFNICSEIIALPNWMEDEFVGMSRNVLGAISIAIMAPLVEELLFRGAIEGHLLKQGKSPVAAILISSLIFGIVHINPAQVPFAFAIGAVFGWLYYRTGSVVPGIIGHFINNSIATIQMMVLSKEELNTKTMDMIGEGPTYALFAASLILMVGSIHYMRKHLPAAPDYTATPCHPEQSEDVLLSESKKSENINEVEK